MYALKHLFMTYVQIKKCQSFHSTVDRNRRWLKGIVFDGWKDGSVQEMKRGTKVLIS